MEQNQDATTGSLTEHVKDLEAFGQAFSLLMNLSKYLDMAGNSVMAGTLRPEDGRAFAQRAGSIYAELRGELLGLINDGTWSEVGHRMLRPLQGEVDLLEAALVVDQSHMWLETSIRRGAFQHRVKLLNLQLGLEEAAANAQLGEQLEKAQVFEKRNGAGSKNLGGGTYV